MARPSESSKVAKLHDLRESGFQLIMNSRAVVEKADFVATGMISAVEGDMVAIEIGEFKHFDLGDLVKIIVYVPGGMRSFRSKIIAKDEGHLYIIHPPIQHGEEKRESPRVEVLQEGSITAMVSGEKIVQTFEHPLKISVKNISASGIGFELDDIHRLMPENRVQLELECGQVITCRAEVVRREKTEAGYFYGVKFTDIAEDKLNSLRAFIIKLQVELFSQRKQIPEQVKKRSFR